MSPQLPWCERDNLNLLLLVLDLDVSVTRDVFEAAANRMGRKTDTCRYVYLSVHMPPSIVSLCQAHAAVDLLYCICSRGDCLLFCLVLPLHLHFLLPTLSFFISLAKQSLLVQLEAHCHNRSKPPFHTSGKMPTVNLSPWNPTQELKMLLLLIDEKSRPDWGSVARSMGDAFTSNSCRCVAFQRSISHLYLTLFDHASLSTCSLVFTCLNLPL